MEEEEEEEKENNHIMSGIPNFSTCTTIVSAGMLMGGAYGREQANAIQCHAIALPCSLMLYTVLGVLVPLLLLYFHIYIRVQSIVIRIKVLILFLLLLLLSVCAVCTVLTSGAFLNAG